LPYRKLDGVLKATTQKAKSHHWVQEEPPTEAGKATASNAKSRYSVQERPPVCGYLRRGWESEYAAVQEKPLLTSFFGLGAGKATALGADSVQISR